MNQKTIIGASPEMLLRITNDKVVKHFQLQEQEKLQMMKKKIKISRRVTQ